MSKTNIQTLAEMEALVLALEALDGQPWAEPADVARAAIEAAREPAREAIFPANVIRLDAAAYAAYAFHRDHLPGTVYDFGPSLAALHMRALDTFPDLAKLLRSPEVIGDVRAAAMSRATVLARDPAELGAEAVQRYEMDIARQIEAAAGHDLAVDAATLVACADFARRLAVAVDRHKMLAAAALARAAEQRAAAERERAKETARRVSEAAAEAARLESEATAARVRARHLRADHIADRLRQSGLTELRLGRDMFSAAGIIENARGMSEEQLERIEVVLSEHGA